MKDDKSLCGLMPGEGGTVLCLEMGGMRRRFMDIGLLPGTRVLCVGKSPLGDPCAYLVRGKTVAIRRADAQGVKLKVD